MLQLPEIGIKSRYAVLCNNHFDRHLTRVYLTDKEYMKQMDKVDSRWVCPVCGNSPVAWDDATYDEALSLVGEGDYD